jgi:hypothetical protein
MSVLLIDGAALTPRDVNGESIGVYVMDPTADAAPVLVSYVYLQDLPGAVRLSISLPLGAIQARLRYKAREALLLDAGQHTIYAADFRDDAGELPAATRFMVEAVFGDGRASISRPRLILWDKPPMAPVLPAELVVTGTPQLTGSGEIGSSYEADWPEINRFEPTELRQMAVFAFETDVVAESLLTPTGVFPAEADGKWVALRWSATDSTTEISYVLESTPRILVEEAFVPPPPPDPGTAPEVDPIPASLLQNAMVTDSGALRPLHAYGATPYTSATTGAGMGNRNEGVSTVLVFLAAWQGVTTVHGGKTPAQRALDHLRLWAGGAMPSADSAYRSQTECYFVVAVALAKRTPAVWNALTATERANLTLGMKACLVGSAWIHSTTHPFGTGFGSNRSVRGMKAGQTNATNYVIGGKLIPFVVAQFLDGGPAEATAFLDGFSRSAFHAELAATGRHVQAALTFEQDWTADLWRAQPETGGTVPSNFSSSGGPTAAQVAEAIDDWRVQVGPGTAYGMLAISEAGQAFLDGIAYVCRHPVRVGVEGEGITPYGILDATRTPSEIRARIPNETSWAGLPNDGLIGMSQELRGSDAGGVRSSMSYTQNGTDALMVCLLALMAQGVAPASSTAVLQRIREMRRCSIDLRYRWDHGYLSYAKGGANGDGRSQTNNETWPGSRERALYWNSYRLLDLMVASYGLDPEALG